MQLAELKRFAENRPCFCGARKVNIWPTSCKGVNIRIRCQCVECGHEFDSNSVQSNYNETFYACLMANGISVTQMQRTLWGLNFAGESENGSFAVDVNSAYNAKVRKDLMPKIVEQARLDQKANLQDCLNSKNPVVYVQADGSYPVRGHSSPVAFVSLLWRDGDKKKIIWSMVVKKDKSDEPELEEDEQQWEGMFDNDEEEGAEDETGQEEETEEDWEKLTEVWAKKSSSMLEGVGIEYALKGPIRKLLEAGKTVKLTMDGDLSGRNRLKGIPGLIVLFDLAHLLKNLPKDRVFIFLTLTSRLHIFRRSQNFNGTYIDNL